MNAQNLTPAQRALHPGTNRYQLRARSGWFYATQVAWAPRPRQPRQSGRRRVAGKARRQVAGNGPRLAPVAAATAAPLVPVPAQEQPQQVVAPIPAAPAIPAHQQPPPPNPAAQRRLDTARHVLSLNHGIEPETVPASIPAFPPAAQRWRAPRQRENGSPFFRTMLRENSDMEHPPAPRSRYWSYSAAAREPAPASRLRTEFDVERAREQDLRWGWEMGERREREEREEREWVERVRREREDREAGWAMGMFLGFEEGRDVEMSDVGEDEDEEVQYGIDPALFG